MIPGMKSNNLSSHLLKMSSFFTVICVKFKSKLQATDNKYIKNLARDVLAELTMHSLSRRYIDPAFAIFAVTD
jgi:hypothetical protein